MFVKRFSEKKEKFKFPQIRVILPKFRL